MTTVISVENLSKQYHLGTIGTGTLAHDLNRWWARMRGKPDPLAKVGSGQWAVGSGKPVASRQSSVNSREHPTSNLQLPTSNSIWALRDVSFEVKQGEVLGIIGRNGAGKSTLLKILSRVTAPTSGEVKVKGRIASLLEVGTGFHPELTGRENIFLNGAILGMEKREIKRKFEEIVAFAEVEKFIDTPVKRYSSGMYVRLAFAVAAHLEPEILLVDEVLAVGDADFQRKCLGRMQNMAEHGRTVLFVSHNLAAVQTLCTRGIILSAGCISMDDNLVRTIGVYLGAVEQSATRDVGQRIDRIGIGQTRLHRAEIFAPGELSSSTLATGHPARFVFQVNRALTGLSCIVSIYSQNGVPVTSLDSAIHGPDDYSDNGAVNEFICDLDELSLTPGRYRINVALMVGNEMQDHLEGVASFDVAPGSMRGRPIESNGGRSGSLTMAHRWKSISSASNLT
jgi:lipopolysaccharide transport system ATP-binding protein